MLIQKFIMEGYTLEQMMTDDDAIEEFVRKAAVGSGTPPVPAGWERTTTRWR